jgi:uncharacterized coiled-coil DUF342 family protein
MHMEIADVLSDAVDHIRKGMRARYGETAPKSGWPARMTKLVSEMDDMRAELDECEAIMVEQRNRAS